MMCRRVPKPIERSAVSDNQQAHSHLTEVSGNTGRKHYSAPGADPVQVNKADLWQ